MLFDFNGFSNAAAVQILEQDRLHDLLSKLECPKLKQQSNDDVFVGRCPVHGNSFSGPNFRLHVRGDIVPIRWACWSHRCHEKYKPSLLGLVWGVLSSQAGKEVSAMKAVAYLRNFLGDVKIEASKAARASKPAASPPPEPAKLLDWSRDDVRKRLVVPSPYFVQRGFSPSVLNAMCVGHSRRLKRSIVPFFDDQGDRIIGYQERTESDTGHPKWRVSSGFPKATYLYNYHNVINSNPETPILLVEGPGDVWRAAEAGILAVACLGTWLSDEHLRKLAGRPIVVAFDNDEAGRLGHNNTHLAFILYDHKNFGFLDVPAQYHDVGDMPAEHLREWFATAIPDSEPSHRPGPVASVPAA